MHSRQVKKLGGYLSGNGLTVGGVDAQVDGHSRDALVGPGDAVGLCLDLLSDLIKIHKLFALTVKELSVFWGRW